MRFDVRHKMISYRIDVEKPGVPRFPFQITLHAPEMGEKGYRCRIEFDGWIDAPPTGIHGNDSWQSVTLAVQLVYSILCSLRSKGVCYYWPNTDVEFDPDQLLAPGYEKGEQGAASNP